MTGKIPPQLVKAHEERLERGELSRELVRIILEESPQPMTVLEIRKSFENVSGKLYDQTYIRRMLEELIDAGKVSTRHETDDERIFRAGGRIPRGKAGSYFWAPAGEVPARTEAVVVDGLLLDSENRGGRRKRKIRRASSKSSGPVAASRVQTDDVSRLIDMLVAERTKELQARIDELEKVLTGIKKATSNV